MSKFSQEAVERIIDDLGYTMASPEASEVYTLIADKNRRAARRRLMKHIGEAEANAVIDYYFARNGQSLAMTEIRFKDLPPDARERRYLISYGGRVQESKLRPESSAGGPVLSFWSGTELVPVQKAAQIWEVMPTRPLTKTGQAGKVFP